MRRRWTTVTLSLVLLCLFISPRMLTQTAYRAIKMTAQSLPVFAVQQWEQIEDEQFTLFYRASDRAVAETVLTDLSDSRQRLQQSWPEARSRQVVAFLYPSQAELQQAVGGSSGAMLGAYRLGRLHLLSPLAWQPQLAPAAAAEFYVSQGPVVHELVHLLLDDQVGGNTPLWFSEGLAQYWELQLKGYRWQRPGVDWRESIVPIAVLDREFTAMDDYVAYRASLSVVEYLYQVYGDEAMQSLITGLGRGRSFEAALTAATGLSLEQLDTDWRTLIVPVVLCEP